MRNKEKGITLIALIITIIVMLILVGVVVTVVIQSDLLGTAKTAGDKYKTAYEDESNMSEVTINGEKYASIEDYLEGKVKLPEGAGKRFSETKEYSDGTKTAWIPAGFTVSGIKSETTIDEGLVIYLIPDDEVESVKWDGTEKTKYDQFVWIPISHEQINKMFICQAKADQSDKCNITVENGVAKCTVHNSTQMAGRLYATSLGLIYKTAYTEVYTANTGLREPDVTTGNNTGDGTNYDGKPAYLEYMKAVTGDNTSYATTAKFKETLQNEYNEIVALIYNAKGYYVGRYETSNITTTKGTAIKVIAGTNSGIASKNWYYMYAQQKVYAENKSLGNKVKSSMMLGTCHDQMLEFVNVAGKYDVTKVGNALHNRKYSDGPWQTAGLDYTDKTQYKDLSKNIYDLEGNVLEWTTEADDTSNRVLRGRLLQQEWFC